VDGAVGYAFNGDVSLAYRVVGAGERDLVLVTGWVLPIELFWDEPGLARFLDRLSSGGRLIVWDKRGTGLSDRLARDDPPTLEERMGDLRAVLDAAGSGRAAIVGISEGAPLAALFAAAHPERAQALAIFGGFARLLASPDHPFGIPPAEFEAFLDGVRAQWSDPRDLLELWAPSAAGDERLRAWWSRALRIGASPTTAVEWLRLLADIDVRPALPAISAPALVLHRTEDRIIPVQHGRHLAQHIPGARYAELPGADHLWWAGDQDAVLDELERFLARAPAPRRAERVLTTVLFTDVVGSTRHAVHLGDRRWRELLGAHHEVVRRELVAHGGREVKTLGDGFLAAFDGPTPAVRCAQAIRRAVRGLGLELRAGVHTGECEVLDGDLAGIAVHIGARIGSRAAPGEVLVSGTVRDLMAGSEVAFRDLGPQPLEGVDGAWRLLAVADGPA
jgi:class 3 adenylate cyclase/pimeloyl-ACP methyl ester carboxylesterase